MTEPAPESPKAAALALAFALMWLAGAVDAAGLLTFGVFPSFMSGDTTQLAVALSRSEQPHAVLLGGVVVLFVAGAFLGRLLRLRTGRRAAVLLLEAALLGAAGGLSMAGLAAGGLALVVLAMGMQNAALSRASGHPVGTYVTGALVRLGSRLADALAGGPRGAFAPDLLLWVGLAVGAWVGAAAWLRYGPVVLLAGAGAALALALATAPEPRDGPAERP